MLYGLQNTLSSRVTNLARSSWSWDIGVINRRRRQPENEEGERVSRTVSKVRVVSSIQEDQTAAIAELHQEQQSLQRKVNEQQMVIDMLKSRLRDSETAVSSEAA